MDEIYIIQAIVTASSPVADLIRNQICDLQEKLDTDTIVGFGCVSVKDCANQQELQVTFYEDSILTVIF